MKESKKFLQTVLVQEDEKETVTLLRETEIYFLFCSSLCKASAVVLVLAACLILVLV